MGFTAPAAGKTGTSHDAWFAGYTSNLICVVWVGNDDYSDIKIEGAHAAAPIWADFMKRAVALPEYSDTKPFDPPPGVVQVQLDKATNLIADAACPDDYTGAFLDGTQPTDTCDHVNGNQHNLFQRIFGLGGSNEGNTITPSNTAPALTPKQPKIPVISPQKPTVVAPARQVEKKKKRGFWSRIFGTHDDDSNDNSQPEQQQ
jgi:penicillin-binding protein 1B